MPQQNYWYELDPNNLRKIIGNKFLAKFDRDFQIKNIKPGETRVFYLGHKIFYPRNENHFDSVYIISSEKVYYLGELSYRYASRRKISSARIIEKNKNHQGSLIVIEPPDRKWYWQFAIFLIFLGFVFFAFWSVNKIIRDVDVPLNKFDEKSSKSSDFVRIDNLSIIDAYESSETYWGFKIKDNYFFLLSDNSNNTYVAYLPADSQDIQVFKKENASSTKLSSISIKGILSNTESKFSDINWIEVRIKFQADLGSNNIGTYNILKNFNFYIDGVNTPISSLEKFTWIFFQALFPILSGILIIIYNVKNNQYFKEKL